MNRLRGWNQRLRKRGEALAEPRSPSEDSGVHPGGYQRSVCRRVCRRRRRRRHRRRRPRGRGRGRGPGPGSGVRVGVRSGAGSVVGNRRFLVAEGNSCVSHPVHLRARSGCVHTTKFFRPSFSFPVHMRKGSSCVSLHSVLVHLSFSLTPFTVTGSLVHHSRSRSRSRPLSLHSFSLPLVHFLACWNLFSLTSVYVTVRMTSPSSRPGARLEACAPPGARAARDALRTRAPRGALASTMGVSVIPPGE